MSFRKLLSALSIALLLGLGATNAHAVDGVAGNDGKFAIGLQGGLAFPKIHVANSTFAGTYNDKDGWVGGVFLEFGIWTITLRPEFNYVKRGYTVAGLAEVNNYYMEIPALLKINPFAASSISPFLVIGPQWSKQVKSEVTPVGGATVAYRNTADEWDLAGVAGAGVEFNLSEKIAFGLQGRYVYGFRDIDSSTTEIKTRAFYALAGLTFQDAF